MIDVLTAPELWAGMGAGLVALVVLGVASVRPFVRWAGPVAAALGGMVPAAAALVAATTPRSVWIAVGVLAVFGAVAAFTPAVATVALAAPGAVMLAVGTMFAGPRVQPPGWLEAVVAVAVTIGATVVLRTDLRVPATAMAALALGGLVLGVPDTEIPLAAFGAYFPVALIGAVFLLRPGPPPPALTALGGAGSFAFAGIFGWAAATGGVGRPASILGGLACVGLLAGIPLAGALGRRCVLSIATLVVQLVLVVLAARTAARQSSIVAAVVIGVAVLMVSTAVVWLLPDRPEPESRLSGA